MSKKSMTPLTLGKRSRNDELEDADMTPTNPSKRLMTALPTTPRRSPRDRLRKWDVDRLSPRHKIFKDNSPHLSRSDLSKKWMDDLDIFFNPLTPMASQTTKSSRVSQGSCTTLGSLSSKTSNESLQAQPNNVRPKRQRRSPINPHQVMVDPHYIPQIGEEDDDYGILGSGRVREYSAPSTGNKKRNVAAAFDEPTPTAGEGINNTRPQAAKRQRTTSSDSSQAKLINSNAKFPPTIRQLEMMERDSLKKQGSKVIKPILPHAQAGKDHVGPEASWLNTWFSKLPSSRVQRKVEVVTKKMKKLKVGGQMSGESCVRKLAL
ncbi:MAG: hypothetical protein Q9182_005315 [Xanthomendoza sp. 2 TL-2023]